MSVTGIFELNLRSPPDEVISAVRALGFPSAQVEEPAGYLGKHLLDLQAHMRSDGGMSGTTQDDLVSVAKYLLSVSDGPVFYSQDLDLREPSLLQEIPVEDIRNYPPRLSGKEGLFMIRN